MPFALTPTQRTTVEALLLLKTPHVDVAQQVNCSVGQVKKMSANLNKYGSVVAPAFAKRGRPLIVDYEMRLVCRILICCSSFSTDDVNRHCENLLRIFLIHTVTKWWIFLQRSSMYLFVRLQLATCLKKRRYRGKRLSFAYLMWFTLLMMIVAKNR